MTRQRAAVRRTLVLTGLSLAVALTSIRQTPADAAPQSVLSTPASGGQLSVGNLRVTGIGGTKATVSFSTPLMTRACVVFEVARTVPLAAPTGGGVSREELARAPRAGDDRCRTGDQASRTQHTRSVTSLKSNTTYVVRITAWAGNGTVYTGERAFMTLKKRLKVTVESITIHSDGDSWLSGDGEPLWLFQLRWDAPNGHVADCFPIDHAVLRQFPNYCQTGNYGPSTIKPLTQNGDPIAFILPEEHFARLPRRLFLDVWGQENDDFNLGDVGGFLRGLADCFPGCATDPASPWPFWDVPMDEEHDYDRQTRTAISQSPGFRSTVRVKFEVYHDNLTYPSGDGPVFRRFW